MSDQSVPSSAVDSHLRSVAKGVSYRLIATGSTLAISFLMTGSVRIATLIGSAEAIAKIVLYWGHERVWHSVSWGRAGHETPRLERAQTTLAPAAEASARQWQQTVR